MALGENLFRRRKNPEAAEMPPKEKPERIEEAPVFQSDSAIVGEQLAQLAATTARIKSLVGKGNRMLTGKVVFDGSLRRDFLFPLREATEIIAALKTQENLTPGAQGELERFEAIVRQGNKVNDALLNKVADRDVAERKEEEARDKEARNEDLRVLRREELLPQLTSEIQVLQVKRAVAEDKLSGGDDQTLDSRKATFDYLKNEILNSQVLLDSARTKYDILAAERSGSNGNAVKEYKKLVSDVAIAESVLGKLSLSIERTQKAAANQELTRNLNRVSARLAEATIRGNKLSASTNSSELTGVILDIRARVGDIRAALLNPLLDRSDPVELDTIELLKRDANESEQLSNALAKRLDAVIGRKELQSGAEREREKLRSLIEDTLKLSRSERKSAGETFAKSLRDRTGRARTIIQQVVNADAQFEGVNTEETRVVARELGRLRDQASELAALLEEEVQREDDEDEASGKLQHRGALEAKAKRFKRSRPFRAFARMLHDPELSETYRLIRTRSTSMLQNQGKEERHRAFAPLLSGLMMNERTGNLLDIAIDDTVAERSEAIKGKIAESMEGSDRAYVPEVVTGTGIHSAIYALNRQMLLPDAPSLTLEGESRIGGQFAQIQADLFRLNSRTRPEELDQPYTPGTRQTLNTFTKFGATQPGDTGMERYQYQSTLGEHARMNLFLTGEPVVDAQVRAVRLNRSGKTPYAPYVVEFLDTATGKLLEVETDRSVFTTGVGVENTGLDETDAATKTIIEEERKRLAEGKDARVMSFNETARRLGDRSDPFPLKDFKRIVMSGEGDGAKVLAGVFLGYETQLGLSTTTLDFIEQITWIGQSFPTKEAFIENCRARYHQLGLEFPREVAENYYARVKPLSNVKAQRLERQGDVIRVVADSTLPEGGSITVEGDHYIYAHGFIDRTDDIVAPAFAEFTDFRDQSRVEKRSSALLKNDAAFNTTVTGARKGVSLFFTDTSDVKRIDVTKTSSGTAITRVMRDGDFVVTPEADADIKALYREVFMKSDELAYMERVNNTPSAVTFNGDQDNPIARRYPGSEIYRAGPAAQLPLTQGERQESPALNTIPENTAAVFRYAPNTAELAQYLAKEDSAEGKEITGFFTKVEAPKEKVIKPNRQVKEFSESVKLSRKDAPSVPFDMPATDLLRYGMASGLEPYRFPPDVADISLTITSDPQNQGRVQVKSEYGLSADERAAVKKAINNPYTLAAFGKLFKAPNARERPIEITLEFENGKLDVRNFSPRAGARTTRSVPLPKRLAEERARAANPEA